MFFFGFLDSTEYTGTVKTHSWHERNFGRGKCLNQMFVRLVLLTLAIAYALGQIRRFQELTPRIHLPLQSGTTHKYHLNNSSGLNPVVFNRVRSAFFHLPLIQQNRSNRDGRLLHYAALITKMIEEELLANASSSPFVRFRIF